MLLGALLFWRCYRWWRAFRLQKKVSRAKRGEKGALDLLEAEGYKIIELQKRAPVCAIVDGKECKTYIAADALVCKGGRMFVAEIKTGSEAPRVTHAPTRRQLLEYFYIFKPHGILLVDMEQKKICEVLFTTAAKNKVQGLGLYILLIFCFLAGIVCGWFIKGGF
jgi:hypothetical protein